MSGPQPSERIAAAGETLLDAALWADESHLRLALSELADRCAALAQAPAREPVQALLERAREVARTPAAASDRRASTAVRQLVDLLSRLTAPPRATPVAAPVELAPATSAAPERGPSAPAELSAQEPPPILVIEDDDDTRNLIARRLRSAGYRVVAAADGGEGIGLARRERPALVISDLDLPLAPGELVILALRTAPETAGIPILVLSGDPGRLGPEHHVDAAVTKPFDAKDLLAAVRRLVGDPGGGG